MSGKKVYIVGTFNTKEKELNFIKKVFNRLELPCATVDVSTLSHHSDADIKQDVLLPEIASKKWKDRGEAISTMANALKNFLLSQDDIAGVIAIGGSGGTALSCVALKALPIGLPKILVSTMASGDIRPYIGTSDIHMVYSITDINGINEISNTILSNAAHSMVGMVTHPPPTYKNIKPNIALTMFGVTTPCVNQVIKQIEKDYECFVFHATGVGGQSMEKLVDSGHMQGVIDITTTEIADHLMGGVLSAGEDRMGAIIRKKIPYVVSVGALDMVNFGNISTVPSKYQNRNLYKHNEEVTLMRTTKEENIKIGTWIANKLNQMEGPVRLLIPEKGVSFIDTEGQPFYDAEADRALFEVLETKIIQTDHRKLIKFSYAINDLEFSNALVKSFKEIIN